MISAPAQLEPYRKSGKLRVIAVDGLQRNPNMPDVPNIHDTLPGFHLSGMGILAAPRGISPDIVQPLNRVMDGIVSDPDYVQRLLNIGFVVMARMPESIAEFLRERRDSWDKVMKGLNVRPE